MTDADTLRKHDIADSSWHAMPRDDALGALRTDPEAGLSSQEVKSRREEFGENRLQQGVQRSSLRRFISQFRNLFIYLLLIAGVVTGLLGEFLDSGVIFAVVLIIAIIGFIQEGRAERALESVQKFLSHEARVTRGGKRQKVSAEVLVPGDIVHLDAGDRVPADLRLLKARNFQAQEAALTGESTAVDKSTDPVDEDAEIGDRSSLAHSGTVVTSGQATGVVARIGEETEIGRISGMLSEVESLKTPLMRRLDAFTKTLSIAIVALAAITFAIGTFLWEREWAEMFFAAVSVAVASIPEGLPAVMTVTLAIGVERMAKRNAIIRKLPAVETLGAVTTICADKTGTLTRNEMTAKTVRTATTGVEVQGVGYEPEGGFTIDGEEADLTEHGDVLEMLRIGLLCNDAEVTKDDGEWRPEGDPMEAALIVLARKAEFDRETEAKELPRTDEIPFASERRYMATLHHDHKGNHFVYVKGAPERLLAMCSKELHGDELRDLDPEQWQAWADEIADRGQRLLAAARKDVGEMSELSEEEVESDLVFLGFFGLIDPARDEAIRSVEICHDAGIRVKMITGDHAKTAAAVARELGIENTDRVLTGRELEDITDDDLRENAKSVDVFARASPEHKLRLVKALQSEDQIVAMTGDGVNDAPALKRADIGIAMGQKGTEAAREASAMVLADDNFASIERAVEEGRVVYDNLRKSILFLLPTNFAQGFIIVLAIGFGLMLPVTPVQILWVNMVTAVTLGIAFAWEKAEGDLMARAPHPTDEPLLTGFVLWRTAFVGLLLLSGAGLLFYFEQQNQDSPVELARTLAVNALVLGQVFYLLNTRSFRAPAYTLSGLTGNRVVWIAIAAIIVLQLLLTYVPFMNTLFGTAPLDAWNWMLCTAIGIAVFVLVEGEKMLQRQGLFPFAPQEDDRPAQGRRQRDDGVKEAGMKKETDDQQEKADRKHEKARERRESKDDAEEKERETEDGRDDAAIAEAEARKRLAEKDREIAEADRRIAEADRRIAEADLALQQGGANSRKSDERGDKGKS
jgi:magnesium-transporting ATPase (P-type)